MGQCVSFVPAKAPPKCKVCGLEGPAPWSKMDQKQRAAWIWKGEHSMCRKCTVVEKMENVQYERDRKRYQQAKEEMYPKPSAGGKPSLKRLASGEKWEGSQSFYSGWKPPSSLKRLLSAIRQAQADDPSQFVGLQRKPTGFVPASAPPALPADTEPHGVGVKHADATAVGDLTSADVERAQQQEHLAATHRQLEALREEVGIEEVEELSINSSVSGSGRASVDHGGELEAAAQEGPPKPQARKLLLKNNSKSRRNLAL